MRMLSLESWLWGDWVLRGVPGVIFSALGFQHGCSPKVNDGEMPWDLETSSL